MSDMGEIIKESLEGIKGFADSETVIGKAINTANGVTIIPISKLTVGFLGGGVDYGQRKISQSQNFGGGSGTGISITPIGFLTVKDDSTVELISLNQEKAGADRFLSLIERSPDIIGKIKNTMS